MRQRPRQRRPGRLQPLLDRQHLPRREAIPPAPVLPKPHQLRRGLHLGQHLAELLGPIGVPRHEPRQLLPGEGALLPGDGIQRHRGLGRDARAVAPGDGVVLGPPLRRLAPLRPALPGRPHLVLRLQRDPLRRQGPMIDPRVVPLLGQPGIRQPGPALPPADQQLRRIPLPRLGAKAPGHAVLPRLDPPGGQQDMRMRLGLAVGALRPVHADIRHHAARHELPRGEVPRQGDPLRLAELARQRHLHLAGQLRVLALLRRLDRIPQRGAVLPGLRRALGQQHLPVHHPGLGGEVLVAPKPVVVQPLGRAIGRGGDRAAAAATRDQLGREVVDRHWRPG